MKKLKEIIENRIARKFINCYFKMIKKYGEKRTFHMLNILKEDIMSRQPKKKLIHIKANSKEELKMKLSEYLGEKEIDTILKFI